MNENVANVVPGKSWSLLLYKAVGAKARLNKLLLNTRIHCGILRLGQGSDFRSRLEYTGVLVLQVMG
jgi:hypothetical protein